MILYIYVSNLTAWEAGMRNGIEILFEEFVHDFLETVLSPKFLFLILIVSTKMWIMEELPDLVWERLRKWNIV